MEAGGGGGGGAVDFGVDGLIALAVLELLLDVGGQGHLAQLLQHLQKNALIVEAHQPVATGRLRLHRGGEAAPVPKDHLGPGLQLPPRAYQTLPQAVPLVGEEEDLTGPAPGQPVADEPGGEHPGVVQHQAVSRTEELGQVVKVVVGDGPGLLVQGQQPGGVPPLQGVLGDEFLREVKIKIGCFQVSFAFLFQNFPRAPPGRPARNGRMPKRLSASGVPAPRGAGTPIRDQFTGRMYRGSKIR